ncbi:enediyne biosynthesis protein UnbU [Myceligenerans salitolerans]|uniref:Enediyne biosynthesis protein UnbU n=1 Tax=Myceligenerans salitolerans TaxID=1230528 RepID=A0ABS3IE31_9MICO|nr:enediyne biosynthesis protein UnbU [Myceligenerans salitolerans]MBO0611238.1 enediyne biosynthesis protein UnbU [Myceligenerans salitolerans]
MTTLEQHADLTRSAAEAGHPPDTAAPKPAKTPEEKRRTALLRFAISITVLNVVGHLLLGFEQAPMVPVIAVLVAYGTSIALEALDARMQDRPAEFAGGGREMFYFLLPAHIAALACSMLIYADNTGPYVFAVVVAVGSKYVFRVRSRGRLRHFLNPSNFGIAVTLLLMSEVGFVPPYMFLNNTDQAIDVLIPLIVLTAGTMLNVGLTGKMPLILAWVGGYVLQAVLRWLFFDDVLLSALGMMTGVAFVLYTNYMITDPGTTPWKPRSQVAFGLGVAMVYGVLIVVEVSYAIFFALTIVCAVRGCWLLLADIRDNRLRNAPAVEA